MVTLNGDLGWQLKLDTTHATRRKRPDSVSVTDAAKRLTSKQKGNVARPQSSHRVDDLNKTDGRMADIRPLELLLADRIGCYLRQQTVKSWLVEPRHGRRLAYRTTDRITDLVDASDQGRLLKWVLQWLSWSFFAMSLISIDCLKLIDEPKIVLHNTSISLISPCSGALLLASSVPNPTNFVPVAGPRSTKPSSYRSVPTGTNPMTAFKLWIYLVVPVLDDVVKYTHSRAQHFCHWYPRM